MSVGCEKTKLQVMICTYGREGVNRVVAGKHPEVEGVEYLVSCQTGNDIDPADFEIPGKLRRHDFKVFFTPTRGLAANRNHALSKTTAPLLLISDDDLDYTADGLKSVIDAFDRNPDSDLLTFRYFSKTCPKQYPEGEFPLILPRKGYSIASVEIAMRGDRIRGKIWFNENFGIGAYFPSGEEDVFVLDCLDHGFVGRHIPVVIARHEGSTTSDRNLKDLRRPITKGAVFLRYYPHGEWLFRMMTATLREIPGWLRGRLPFPGLFLVRFLRGVMEARRRKVFPTPDYSEFYPLSSKR